MSHPQKRCRVTPLPPQNGHLVTSLQKPLSLSPRCLLGRCSTKINQSALVVFLGDALISVSLEQELSVEPTGHLG